MFKLLHVHNQQKIDDMKKIDCEHCFNVDEKIGTQRTTFSFTVNINMCVGWWGVVCVVWCVCGVWWCGVGWGDVVWCGVVWYGVVWCGVMWYGVVWCGVV